MNKSCPICQSKNARTFFSSPGYPVFSVVYYSSEALAKQCRRGDVELAFCGDCGFIWNVRFDPAALVYDESYTNSLHHSGFFQSYAESETNHILFKWSMSGKSAIELGCGKGDFLKLLARQGRMTGVGYDSSYPGEEGETVDGIVFRKGWYQSETDPQKHQLAIARQVLEHISEPLPFLKNLAGGLDPSGMLYVEVPNSRHLLEGLSIWDIIYEHCGYFTSESLESAFKFSGLVHPWIRSTFQGLNLVAECTKTHPAPEPNPESHILSLKNLSELVSQFTARCTEKKTAMDDELNALIQSGKRVVLWGAGARGSSFGVVLKNGGLVKYAVDLNPEKHGLFLAGSGAKVVPPEFLQEYQPHTIFIMNPVYRPEIEAQLQSLGVQAHVRIA